MTALTGTILDTTGNPITGTLYLQLSQNANLLPAGGGPAVVPREPPSIFNLTNGVITGPGVGPYSVYGIDVLSPAGLTYWLTATSASGAIEIQREVSITGVSVNLGDLSDVSAITTTPLATSSALSGDVGGTLAATSVNRLRGRNVDASAPIDGQGLIWDASSSIWRPRDLAAMQNGLPVFNVKTYGARGDGSTNDAAAIASAVTAAIAGNGGIVFFPPGRYLCIAAGISTYLGVGVYAPILLQGSGLNATVIEFRDTIPTPECIKIGSASAIGSGYNFGGGIRDMTLQAPATTDIVTVANAEQLTLENIWFYLGKNALNVVESRACDFRKLWLRGWKGTGIKVTGEVYSPNLYEHIEIVGDAASTGWGVDYTKTSGADTGGIYFNDVIVNASGKGGFNFDCTVQHSLFAFLSQCVADGTFPEWNYRFVKAMNVVLNSCWGVNATVSKGCIYLSNVGKLSVDGGQFFSNLNASSIFSLNNFCDSISVNGSILWAPGGINPVLYSVDATPHSNLRLAHQSGINAYCNDFSKLGVTNPDSCFPGVATLMALANGLNSNVGIDNGMNFEIAGPTGVFSLGGMTNWFDGRVVELINLSGFQMTIVHEDASSTAANRITTQGKGNVNCTTARLRYNPFLSRWVLMSYTA